MLPRRPEEMIIVPLLAFMSVNHSSCFHWPEIHGGRNIGHVCTETKDGIRKDQSAGVKMC